MPRQLKKAAVKCLIGLLVGLRAIGRLLLVVLGFLTLPLLWAWRFGLRRLVFLLYRLVIKAKIATGTLVDPMRKTVMALLGHRYVVHGTVLIMTLFVASKNLYAREANLGTRSTESLIYQLIDTESDYDITASSEGDDLGMFESASGTDITSEISTYDQSGVVTPVVLPGVDVTRVVISKPEKVVVQSGDTLSGIAQRYGVSINTLLWANGLTTRSVLRLGQELTVLPVSGVLHTVKKGDTLDAIAKKYGADQEKILAANRIADAKQIQIGEGLVIPDGRPPAAPAPALTSRAQVVRNAFLPSESAPPGATVIEGQLVWPTDSRRINQYFKWNHPGLDIYGRLQNTIYAVDDGIVTKAGWNSGGYGNMILVDHGNGMITRYGHASVLYAKAGDQVKKGQSIAMIGSTGRSTGPHLHFELYWGGKRRNPLEFYK